MILAQVEDLENIYDVETKLKQFDVIANYSPRWTSIGKVMR